MGKVIDATFPDGSKQIIPINKKDIVPTKDTEGKPINPESRRRLQTILDDLRPDQDAGTVKADDHDREEDEEIDGEVIKPEAHMEEMEKFIQLSKDIFNMKNPVTKELLKSLRLIKRVRVNKDVFLKEYSIAQSMLNKILKSKGGPGSGPQEGGGGVPKIPNPGTYSRGDRINFKFKDPASGETIARRGKIREWNHSTGQWEAETTQGKTYFLKPHEIKNPKNKSKGLIKENLSLVKKLSKARHYLSPGQKAPKGASVQTGTRGGKFFDTKLLDLEINIIFF